MQRLPSYLENSIGVGEDLKLTRIAVVRNVRRTKFDCDSNLIERARTERSAKRMNGCADCIRGNQARPGSKGSSLRSLSIRAVLRRQSIGLVPGLRRLRNAAPGQRPAGVRLSSNVTSRQSARESEASKLNMISQVCPNGERRRLEMQRSPARVRPRHLLRKATDGLGLVISCVD